MRIACALDTPSSTAELSKVETTKLMSNLAGTGRPAPASAAELPGVLGRELQDLQAVYRPPGALLVAYHNDEPAGCVGLAHHATGTAEVKRLYVRPALRGKGIARAHGLPAATHYRDTPRSGLTLFDA